MKRYLFWIVIIMMASAKGLLAQRPQLSDEQIEKLKSMRVAEISGKAIDAETGEPLSFANVYLHSLKDSSIVSGAIAKENGEFKIEKLPFGRFFLKVKFIGYDAKTVDDILLMPRKKSIALGDIKVSPSTVKSEGVQVTAEKESIEYKVDRKIINVDQNIAASGGSAVEALERAPSVSVDIEGNVSLRGSSNFTVFINGKPSVLDGSDALQQIPASSIDHIELITNPSAKYDPDGLAGIINVILKENALSGVSGLVNISGGVNDKYTADAKLNWSNDGLKLTGGIDYNSFYFFGDGNMLRNTFYGDTVFTLTEDMSGRFHRERFNVKAGAEYDFSNSLNMSLEFGYGVSEFGRRNSGEILNTSNLGNPDVFSTSSSLLSRNSDFFTGSYSLNYNIDNIGQKLNFLAFASFDDGNGDDFQQEYEMTTQWDQRLEQISGVRNDNFENEDDIRLQLDYVKPFSEDTKFEAGLQSRIANEEENYDFYQYDTDLQQWKYYDLFSTRINFKRNIHAAYAQFASELFTVDYQVGLRAEYTDREVSFDNSDERYVIDRVDFFPTFHISKKFEGMHQVMASYSRRINRPRGRHLDPHPSYRDAYNYHVGNPQLEPEYNNSYELGYSKMFDKSMISIEGYYRDSQNEFERYQTLDSNGILIHTIDNLASAKTTGVEFMFNYKPADWMNLNFVGNFYNYSIEGDIVSEDLASNTESWEVRFFTDFKIFDNFRLQLNSFYEGPTVTAQGTREGYFFVDAGLRYDLMPGKLSLSMNMRDIFDTRKYEMTSQGQYFRTDNTFNREGRILMLNLNWRFNNYKEDRRRGGNGGDGDVDMEMF